MSKDIYKFLISSPCMITGKYESESFKIKTVFPNSISQQKRTYDKDNMNSQRYYVIEMVIESDFEGDENNNGFKEKIFKLDYGDIICEYLACLYGKVFYCHGAFEYAGYYDITENHNIYHSFFNALPYNSTVRESRKIELSFSNINLMKKFQLNNKKTKSRKLFLIMQKLYLKSLREFEKDKDSAYLSLITCGEVISSFIYKEEKILNKDFLFKEDDIELFNEIEDKLDDGKAKAKKVKEKMGLITSKFVESIYHLLDDKFYQTSLGDENFKFSKDNIKEKLENAYKLRSKYVHEGFSFGEFTDEPNKDFGNKISSSMKENEKKKLTNSPTFFGLENIIYYCINRINDSYFEKKVIK